MGTDGCGNSCVGRRLVTLRQLRLGGSGPFPEAQAAADANSKLGGVFYPLTSMRLSCVAGVLALPFLRYRRTTRVLAAVAHFALRHKRWRKQQPRQQGKQTATWRPTFPLLLIASSGDRGVRLREHRSLLGAFLFFASLPNCSFFPVDMDLFFCTPSYLPLCPASISHARR
ncbi:uncharacterized protein Tco025E_05351 [Trypanosoma conorhini]|uniref:Transmembrane protein n=1 Tax=Trypanosoma conorhini TaxID=83891 RepID=A0A422PDW4_9TRYP|nr:uncharacterized protein Tco025E_05351 [Trypanosoma conorhini]RNF15915.1 hypothetical protein Tco025E_05351 [Trypanosoma conorhini]